MKILIIPALLLSFAAFAQTRELPRVPVPEGLENGAYAEGTMTRLAPEEVAGFLPWAQNARNQLNRALAQARTLPLRDRPAHIDRARPHGGRALRRPAVPNVHALLPQPRHVAG